MDTGIHLPSFLKSKDEKEGEAKKVKEREEPEVCTEACQLLKDFTLQMRTKYYEEASSLYEGAKNLYEEMHVQITGGKRRVINGNDDFDVDDLDRDLLRMFHKQEHVWEKLLEAEQEMRSKIDPLYKQIKEMEEKVRHERGYDDVNHHHVAWMFIPTMKQHMIRKEYQCKLKQEFKDAKMEYEMLCGYPEGLLTQIGLLHKRGSMEAADIIAKLRECTALKKKIWCRIPGAALFV